MPLLTPNKNPVSCSALRLIDRYDLGCLQFILVFQKIWSSGPCIWVSMYMCIYVCVGVPTMSFDSSLYFMFSVHSLPTVHPWSNNHISPEIFVFITLSLFIHGSNYLLACNSSWPKSFLISLYMYTCYYICLSVCTCRYVCHLGSRPFQHELRHSGHQ